MSPLYGQAFVVTCISAALSSPLPPFVPACLRAFVPLLLFSWVCQAVLSALQVRKFSRRLDRPQLKGKRPFQPPAVVIVPFKGLDIDLPAALQALCEQDYPAYQLLLVVESEDDPAYAALQEQLGLYPTRQARVIVAGQAEPHQGQKVHNQLVALDLIETPTEGDQVWVFADSDAVPGPYWLAAMVQPLVEKRRTGAVTGYRWLIPSPESAGIWSPLASVLNSSVACLVGARESLNHVWGGSMAVLAATAERGGLRQRLAGALTDDHPVTQMCRDLNLRVYFPNRLLIASTVEFDRKGFFNFAYRQYVLTRVYAPRLFATALAVLSLYVAGVVCAWWSLAWSWRQGGGVAAWGPPAAALLAVFVANQVRNGYRRRVVAKALGPKALADLKPTLGLDRWGTTAWMALHWALVVRACYGRTFTWRGIRYRLRGAQRVERLD